MSTYQTLIDDITPSLTTLAGGTSMTNVFDILAIVPSTTVAGYNSKMRIRAKASDPTYTGFKDVYFNRLDLGDLGKLLVNCARAQLAIGVQLYSVLDVIRDQVGIRFTTADLNDATTVLEADGTVSVLLVAKSTSQSWLGSYKLIMQDTPTLASYFYTNQLGPL